MTPRSRPQPKSFVELTPQLFLVALLVVTVGAVLVWLLFGASAKDSRSVSQLIADIRSGGKHARQQDAHALAQKAIEIQEAGEYFSAEETGLLTALVRSEEDSDLVAFYTVALGRAGRPERTVPVLRELLEAAESSPATRLHATVGLGLSGSADAIEPLLAAVERGRAPGDWELRWSALAGLAHLRAPLAVDLLREALTETRRELRWSAACWLANTFGDASGVEILEQLVDWEFLDAQKGETGRALLHEEKENYMLMALEGLARVRGAGVRDVIEEKTRDKRSPKVRNAALRLRDQLGASSGLMTRRSAVLVAAAFAGHRPPSRRATNPER